MGSSKRHRWATCWKALEDLAYLERGSSKVYMMGRDQGKNMFTGSDNFLHFTSRFFLSQLLEKRIISS